MTLTRRTYPEGVLLIALLAAHFVVHAQLNPPVELVDRPCPMSGIRIAVFADGRVELNGAQIQVSQIPSALERLAPAATEFCIHREHPEAAEPHPNMLRVLDAVIRQRLPVAFYWDIAFQRRVAFKG